jgi:hypothetical protein
MFVSERAMSADHLDGKGLAIGDHFLPSDGRRELVKALPRFHLATNQRDEHPHRRSKPQVDVVDGPQITRKQDRSSVGRHGIHIQSPELVRKDVLEATRAGRSQGLAPGKLDHARTLQKRGSENKHRVAN